MEQKTHREVKTPQISVRYLADHMAASETSKRSIVRGCKYQPIARIIQHDKVKLIISKFIRSGNPETSILGKASDNLRSQLADTDFDKDVLDHNADYVDRFAEIWHKVAMPEADIEAPGTAPPANLSGVKVNVELQFRLRRITTTNKTRIGAGMLRYAKGKALPPAVGDWQSAFILGYLKSVGMDEGTEAEHKLCLTIDAYSGIAYPAPTNAVSRYNNMIAACASIAERWPNIQPPKNAVF